MEDDKRDPGIYIQKMSLRSARILSGLSAADVVERAGITRSALSLYETGKRRPTRAVKHMLASIYGVPVDVLDVEEKLPSNMQD